MCHVEKKIPSNSSPMHDPNGVMLNNVCALKVCTLTSEYKTRKHSGSSPDS